MSSETYNHIKAYRILACAMKEQWRKRYNQKKKNSPQVKRSKVVFPLSFCYPLSTCGH